MVEPRRRFRFLKELSEGAFGKVYMAEMITGEGFSSIVAIKLLHGKWVGHQEIAQRSRDEARLLGLLHHRNIVRVEDLSSINGQCAIIMEYLDGVDLKALINYSLQTGVHYPRRVAFEIGGQIAGALEAAYEMTPLKGGGPLHVIHRDIKPSNVMVTAAGDVKVLDFGTARANFEEREAKTQALAFGSQAYMAPERLLGDPDTPAADVFSLGVTLYEFLSLRTFGKIYIRPDKYDKALEERLEGLDFADLRPEVADQIRLVLRSMLAYDGESRPTAGAVVDLMENLAELVNDGSLQRFCRQVVKPCHESVAPRQNSDDPLTGSTLFEDASTGFTYTAYSDVPSEEDLAAAAAAEAVGQDAGGHEAVEDHAPEGGEPEPEGVGTFEPSPEAQAWDAPAAPPPEAVPEPNAWSPPAQTPAPPWSPPAQTPAPPWSPPASAPPPSSRTVPPASRTIPPVPVTPPVSPVATMPPQPAWTPQQPVASAPPPVAVQPAPPPVARPPVAAPVAVPAQKPAPSSGGGVGKFIAIGVVLVLLVGGGLAAVLLGGGKDEPAATPPTTEAPKTPVEASATPAASAGQPGGRHEVGAAGPSTGSLKLSLAAPGAVSLTSTSGFKFDWDGTGTLELVNLPAGSYRTKIQPAQGAAVRSTLDVTASKTCAFSFDASKGSDWEAGACE